MCYSIILEVIMEDIRFDGKLERKIDNIGFINVLRSAGYSFEFKSGKPLYSLILVESGELEYRFINSGENIRIKKGQLLYIPKLLPYRAEYLKDGTKVKALTFDISSDTLPDFYAYPAKFVYTEILTVFSGISTQNTRNTLYLSAKIYELLYLLESDTRNVPKKYQKILPAITEINRKYFENQKLSYYSDMCNMSESNFRKLFREYTGKSPVEYRNNIRLFEVKKMIASGEFTVAEAAYTAGFNNMSFFYKIYGKR